MLGRFHDHCDQYNKAMALKPKLLLLFCAKMVHKELRAGADGEKAPQLSPAAVFLEPTSEKREKDEVCGAFLMGAPPL